ncbi:MAG TPA: NUDIX domain-containing protein [Flavobacterium sp.]|jgi:nudix-type nucleoside diphosphatase (YffH/AdpP family)
MQNPVIHITNTDIISDKWAVLKQITFEYETEIEKQTHTRQVYDRGNGAVILLYNTTRKTVLLIKQFRLPTYLNDNETGVLIEACAGVLEEESPEACIRRETEEETGYQITEIRKIFEAYTSPGVLTEIIHFFIGEYNAEMKVSDGGGLKEEQENIEVIELPFAEAYNMIATGEIKDAKTIMLLQYAKINLSF